MPHNPRRGFDTDRRQAICRPRALIRIDRPLPKVAGTRHAPVPAAWPVRCRRGCRKIGIYLPMPERLGGYPPVAGSGSRRGPHPSLQVHLEPLDRLTSEFDSGSIIGRRFVLSSAAAGQGGDAGRVVRVLGPGIVAKSGIVGQRVGVKPGRCRVPLLLVGASASCSRSASLAGG